MVRNPYSLVVSAFFYLANNKLSFKEDRKIRDKLNLKHLDFKEFVKKVCYQLIICILME